MARTAPPSGETAIFTSMESVMSHMLTQRIPILGVARCGEDDGRDGGKPQNTWRWSNLRNVQPFFRKEGFVHKIHLAVAELKA
jgi:hypothetical protein